MIKLFISGGGENCKTAENRGGNIRFMLFIKKSCPGKPGQD
jgi:hypothetical protein